MVSPGMLESPVVQAWLGGVQPAWTLLDHTSFVALGNPPSPSVGPIRLATDVTESEIGLSAIARNAAVLLNAAGTGPGLKLTVAGNLSRKAIRELSDRFVWPDADEKEAFQFRKAVNEQDLLRLSLLRHLVQVAGLVRAEKGHLALTSTGRGALAPSDIKILQAVLFHVAFWGPILRSLGMGIPEGWPQRDIGIVLWSLSIAANDWESRERLARLCTVPVIGVLEHKWDIGSYALEARILQPLLWFGLLEYRQGAESTHAGTRHFYRKTPLFDRFLRFHVRSEVEKA